MPDTHQQFLNNCLRKISSAYGMKNLAAHLSEIKFEVVDQLDDPKASAQFTPGPNGTASIAIKRSVLENGESWELYNALIHELTHYFQNKDPNLAPYFSEMMPDGKDSARVNILLELDAYVKTQMIMEDLQTSGKVPAPAKPEAFSNQVASLYEQIKEAGYSHETGEAGTVLFRSMLDSQGGFCVNYIWPRTLTEYQQLEEMHQFVAEKQIQEGKFKIDNFRTEPTPSFAIADTPLGKLREQNFMQDDNGNLDYLDEPDFLTRALSEGHHKKFEELCAARDDSFRRLKPYITPNTPVRDTGERGGQEIT